MSLWTIQYDWHHPKKLRNLDSKALSKSVKSLGELRGIFVGEAIDQVPTIGHIASEHLVDGLERGGFQSDGAWEKETKWLGG